MAGSGGGSAQGMTPYQESGHGLIMAGNTRSNNDWHAVAADQFPCLTDEYEDNPSVLRFILERGLTGLGGNPFEGVSTFDPGDDLDAIEDGVNDYVTKVDEIDPETDWGANLDLAQTEQTGQVPELDVDAVFTNVIGDSMARALQIASQAYMTAKSDGETLMDSIVTRAESSAADTLATAESDADIKSSSLIESERDEAASGMSDSRTAFALTEVDAQADVDDVFEDAIDKAVAKAGEVGGDDIGTGSSMSFMSSQAKDDASTGTTQAASDSVTNVDAMSTAMDTSLTAADAIVEIAGDVIFASGVEDAGTGISDLVDATSSALVTNEEMVDSVGAKAAINASVRVQSADDQADISSDTVIDAINTKVGAASALGETQSDNIYDDAKDDGEAAMTSINVSAGLSVRGLDTEADGASQTNSQDVVSDAATNAVTHADALSAAELAKGSSNADTVGEKALTSAQITMNGAVINAVTHADTLSTAELDKGWGNADVVDGKALASAQLTMEDAVVNAKSRALADSADVETALRTNVKTAMADIMEGAAPEVAPLIQASLQDALGGAQTAVSMAIAAAEEIIESAPIAKAVATYRRRALSEHLRSVNRFAGGMADINAVNSSAFIIGMALRESDFEDKILDYQAGLETQLYSSAFPVYIDTFKGVMSSYLETYKAQQAHMISIANNSTSAITGVFVSSLTQYIESYMRGFVEYIGLCKDAMGTYSRDAQAVIDPHMKGFAEYIGLYKDAAGTYSRDAQAAIGAETGLYNSLYGNITGAGTQLSDIQGRMTQAAIGLRQTMVNNLSRMQMEIYTQVLTSHIDTEAGIFSTGMGSATSFGNVHSDLIKEVIGLRQKLAADLGRAYTGTYDNSVSSQLDSASSMFKSGFDSSKQAGNSKAGITKDLVDKYLRTYVDLLAQQSNSASIFSTMGRDKLAAFKDVLTAKLGTFSDVANKELGAFDRSFLGHMQTAGDTLRDHVKGTLDTRIEEKREKQSFVNTHTANLHNMKVYELEASRAATNLLGDLHKAVIVARGEQYEKNLEYDAKADMWDMNLFQKAGNVLSAVTGSVIKGPDEPSKTQSMIGGMATGMGAGIQLGMAVPGVGPAVGAGVGALAGAIAGYQG